MLHSIVRTPFLDVLDGPQGALAIEVREEEAREPRDERARVDEPEESWASNGTEVEMDDCEDSSVSFADERRIGERENGASEVRSLRLQ